MSESCHDSDPNGEGGFASPLGESFYSRSAPEVAEALLGCYLIRHVDATPDDGGTGEGSPGHGADDSGPMTGRIIGRIVETEAYVGEHDGASHARFGRTGRTAVMYGPPGRSYIYLIYGMYQMLNVVCGPVGDPQAVLIRGLEPVTGGVGRVDGPGRLTRELGIDKEMNGLPLWGPPISIHPGPRPAKVEVTPRIGIDYAAEWRDAPLRFVASG